MPLWLQHLLVLSASGACLTVIVRQALATLRGTGKLGSCCSRGCATPPQTERRTVLVQLGIKPHHRAR